MVGTLVGVLVGQKMARTTEREQWLRAERLRVSTEFLASAKECAVEMLEGRSERAKPALKRASECQLGVMTLAPELGESAVALASELRVVSTQLGYLAGGGYRGISPDQQQDELENVSDTFWVMWFEMVHQVNAILEVDDAKLPDIAPREMFRGPVDDY